MKKFFALIAVFAMVASFSAYAAPTVAHNDEAYVGEFSAIDYINGFDTIPAFYTGTLKYEGKFSPVEICKLNNVKGSIPAYMALCIPCLKCFYNCALVDGEDNVSGCEELGEARDTAPMTGTVYFVTQQDKRNKIATIMEIPLNSSDPFYTFFFNYGAGSKDKQVALLVTEESLELPWLYMGGEKDSKKWSICDAANNGKKTSLSVTMPKSFSGYASFVFTDDNTYGFDDDDCGRNSNGTTTAGLFGYGLISFKRDDSKTKKIMSWMCGVEEECYYSEGSECEDVIDDALDLIFPQSKGWNIIYGNSLFIGMKVRDI